MPCTACGSTQPASAPRSTKGRGAAMRCVPILGTRGRQAGLRPPPARRAVNCAMPMAPDCPISSAESHVARPLGGLADRGARRARIERSGRITGDGSRGGHDRVCQPRHFSAAPVQPQPPQTPVIGEPPPNHPDGLGRLCAACRRPVSPYRHRMEKPRSPRGNGPRRSRPAIRPHPRPASSPLPPHGAGDAVMQCDRPRGPGWRGPCSRRCRDRVARGGGRGSASPSCPCAG